MRKLLVSSLAVFMLVLASAPAWAMGISSATIDSAVSPNTITITGAGFNARPQVWFNSPVPNPTTEKSRMLTPTSASTTSITATLPSGIAPGMYELIVRNPVNGAVARYEITYGAANNSDVSALTTRFANLSTSKTAADAGLYANIGNETTRATGVEGILSGSIGAETTRATTAEAGLTS
ncbi:MAG: hypothetical protein ACYDFU_10060, partial [Nitrospirota bacterium]